MTAAFTSAMISLGLLAILLGGIGFELRRRWPAVVDALAVDRDMPPAARPLVSRAAAPGRDPAAWQSPARRSAAQFVPAT